jgi:hypothetical protein
MTTYARTYDLEGTYGFHLQGNNDLLLDYTVW